MLDLKELELDAEETAVVEVVRDFVDREVRPVARELEHNDTYPEKLIEQMKELGIFGLAVPEPWGEVSVTAPCYAAVTEELARGWMSLAGAMGGHTVVAKLLVAYGSKVQQDRYLPRLATGELRATMALTEPGGGSDLQALRTTARRDGDDYVVNGSKTWITNARRSDLVALLCRTDADAEPAHRGISILLVEKGPGFEVSRDLPKLGYKGVESCELSFDDFRTPSTSLLGDEEGQGFAQMMRGLEIGRIQVASRALGVGRAALEDSLAYAQERESFGKPIWQHQSIGNYLADMATSLTAARQLVMYAARRYDSGQRADLEAGMAKLFASETAMKITLDAVRIHGGYGYSTEFDVERYFRDAPLMIVGEGTNEIQRNVIARQLVKRHPEALMTTEDAVTWLFVPGTREDRFDRAAAAGADEIILDLEDAVPPTAKDEARQSVASWLRGSGEGWVRINGLETDWWEHDLAAVGGQPGLRGLVVPKAEDAARLTAWRERLPAAAGLVALVETARGIDSATAVASSGAVDRLAFGSVDFALDVGADETDDALLYARSRLVVASRTGGLPAPLDGVTVSTTDDAAARGAAARARQLGFGGKLCIHPHQVGPVAEGFRPTAAQLDWAVRVLEAAEGGPDPFTLDGEMVDRPVVARARSIAARGGVRP